MADSNFVLIDCSFFIKTGSKMPINPILGEGGQFDHSIRYSVTIFLALGPGSPKFMTLLLNIKVSTW